MSDGDAEDTALLDGWCAGDNAAGNRLFRRHYRAVYRFFEGKVERDIDEAVQETFLVCVRKRDQFRRDASFRTFLFAIARLVLHEHWRRLRSRETPVDFDEISVASLTTSVGSRIARRHDQRQLLDALIQLPLDQQLLLELHYWEKLDGAALAGVFDVEPATIRSRLFRAREALRAQVAAGAPRPGLVAGDDAGFDAWARSLQPPEADRSEGDS